MSAARLAQRSFLLGRLAEELSAWLNRSPEHHKPELMFKAVVSLSWHFDGHAGRACKQNHPG